MLTISAILDCQFVLTDKKFWCALGFFTIRKSGSNYRIKFCIKNYIKCVKTFEMLTVAFWRVYFENTSSIVVKKMILDNRRITLYQAIFTDVLGMKRSAAKIVPKFAKFWAKTTSHGHRSGHVDDDPDLLKKVITGDEAWVYGKQ